MLVSLVYLIKEIGEMSLKKNVDNIKNARAAAADSYKYIIVLLLIDSFYNLIQYDKLGRSFIILIISLIIFYVLDFLYKKRKY